MVVALDDFDVIFGLDFLKKVNITLMPYLDGALIDNEVYPNFVPCYNIFVLKESKDNSSMILSIAIEKALKKSVEVLWQ